MTLENDSYVASPQHIGLCRTVKVLHMPNASWNGYYDLNTDSRTMAYIQRRVSSSMSSSLRKQQPPARIVYDAEQRTWAFHINGHPRPLRRVETTPWPSLSSSSAKQHHASSNVHPLHAGGVYVVPKLNNDRGSSFSSGSSGSYGTGKSVHVELVHNAPSMIAKLAFPYPRVRWDFYPTFFQRPGFTMLRTSRGERVPAMLYRYEDANAAATAPKRPLTILYSHGNAEDMFLNDRRMRALCAATRCNILAYDFVGYSTSRFEGHTPSEHGCFRAIEAAYGYLTTDLGVAPEQIVLYGRSIGSGPTVHLASLRQCRHRVAGVVLECGILSAIKVVLGPIAGVLARPFDLFVNDSKLHKVTRPVAVMHGREDRVVRHKHGVGLNKLAQRAFPMLSVDAGHNDMPYHTCDEHVCRFLEHLLGLANEERVENTEE